MLIFISYARVDGSQLANYLADQLRSSGHDPWLDRERMRVGAIWTEEIEINLDSSDVVLALLSDGSYKSEVCRAETLRAFRAGKRLIPILVHQGADRALHLEARDYIDFSDAGLYESAMARLLDGVRGKVGYRLPERMRNTYVTASPPQEPFIARPSELRGLREKLLSDETAPYPVAIVGMGGRGKTTIAKALCADATVQAAFSDGIVWLSIGGAGNDLVLQLRELGKVLAQPLDRFDTLTAAQNQVRTAIRDKALLIVLDDVRTLADIQFFSELRGGCRIVFTTRDKRLAAALNAVQFELPSLDKTEGVRLLAARSRTALSDLPPEAEDIVEFCDGLPLAIAMVGAMLDGYPMRWKTALKRLREARLRWVRQGVGGYEYSSIHASIEVSLRELPAAERERYLSLAVFPKGESIPLETLAMYWDVEADEAEDTAILVNDLSLGSFDSTSTLKLHNLHSDYVWECNGPENVRQQHERLLDRYASVCGGEWSRGPRDGYFFQHLAYHLDAAGRKEDLDSVLFDYAWLEARLVDADPVSVSNDFNYAAAGDAGRKVQHAVLLSSHALRLDRGHLASQLTGRLLDEDKDPRIVALLQKAGQSSTGFGLMPLLRSLEAPLGWLRTRMFGHEQGVRALVLSPDGSRLISGSRDQTIRVWDVAGNQPCRILHGHEEGIAALAIEPISGYLFSGSWDKTIKAWDLETGEVVHTLTGHEGPVLALGIIRSTGQVVSSGPDGSIRIWDAASGAEERRLQNFSRSVFNLAITPDEKYVLCVGYDESVKIIDLESGALARQLKGHRENAAGDGIAITEDGRFALSASFDETVKIWDLRTGGLVRTLAGHRGGVRSVSLCREGQFALSGSNDGTIILWNLNTGERVRAFYGHEGPVDVVIAAPSGAVAYSASDDGSVAVWDLTRDSPEPTVGIPGGVDSLHVQEDGRKAIFGNHTGEIHLCDFEDPDRNKLLTGHEQSVTVAGTPDGRRALSWSKDQILRVWNLENLEQVASFPAEGSWLSATIAISTDGSRAAFSDTDKLITWDLETGRELGWSDGGTIRSSFGGIAFTEDGSRLIVPNDNALNVYDAVTHEIVYALPDLKTVRDLAISREDRIVCVCGYSEVWYANLGAPAVPRPALLFKQELIGCYVDITRDGKLAVVAGDDRLIRVWDLDGKKLLASFAADKKLADCAIAEDGNLIIAAESAGTVHLLQLRRPAHGAADSSSQSARSA